VEPEQEPVMTQLRLAAPAAIPAQEPQEGEERAEREDEQPELGALGHLLAQRLIGARVVRNL
jgi:hypothetical protein